MFHLAAFFKTEAGAATLDNITAVQDQSITIDANGNFLFQNDGWKVQAMAALGATLGQARLRSPFLQSIFLPDLYPVIVSATVPDNAKVSLYGQYGPPIRKNDPINLQATVTGAGDVFGLMWVGDGAYAPPPGPVYQFPMTATATLVKGAWVNAPLTSTQQLPSGSYAVVGMQIIGTAVLAGRLVFVGNNNVRPDVIGQPTLGFDILNQPFVDGAFGLFGTFDNTSPPTIDLLGLAAGAQTPQVWLDLVKIR